LQVRAAFGVSYAQLAAEDARLFRLLGLHPGPDFDAGSAAALAGTGAEVASLVLDRLAGAHLVAEDATGRFGMHDLLRLYARATCEDIDSPADREAAEARLVSYYADLATFLDSCVDPELRPAAEQAAQQDGGMLPSMREALAIFQAERPGLLAAFGLAAQRGWDQQARQLGISAIDSLTVLRYLDDLLAILEISVAVARRAGDRYGEGQALNNLGNAYQELQRFEEAIGCHEQALAIRRERGDRRGEGLTLNNLGNAYQGPRRFEEAIGCYQQALAIRRESGDRYGEGQALNNLGSAYQQLSRFEEAIGCYQQDIAICRESGDRYGEGLTLNNLGSAYQELSRFEEAIGCHEQALAICRESGDRYGEGQALDGLGSAYQELRRFEEAAESWREAAMAMRDVGEHDEAQRLEHLAGGTQSRPRRRWGLRRKTSS
jgi:tetratricopeptide (TPR) repeat protein